MPGDTVDSGGSPRAVRVAVIPPQFDPALNYQENVCANALHRAGYEVSVFTSWFGIERARRGAGPDPAAPFPVHRARRVLRFRETQLPLDPGTAREIRRYDPEVVFLMAPLHGLGWAWMKLLPPTSKIGAFFSDIPWHRRNAKVRSWIKRRMARSVFERVDRVYPVTRQTAELLEAWGGPEVVPKLQPAGLAVDFRSLEGTYDLPDEVVALRGRVERMGAVVTRVTPEKALHLFFSHIERYLTQHGRDGFVIAGLGDDAPSQLLRDAVAASGVRDRVSLLGALPGTGVGALFRCADFSVWNSVSIGIYHSLASRCPAVVYSRRGSAENLVEEGVNGMWFDAHEDAPEVIGRARDFDWDGERIRRSVGSADADKVFPGLVEDLLSGGGSGGAPVG